MINCLTKFATIIFATLVAAAAFAFVTATPLHAQQDTFPSRNAPAIARDMRYREWILRDLKKNGNRRTEEQQRLALAQIKEDFERIQVVSDNMMRAISADGTLDHKLIAAAAAEIKKRASRLKSNLSFPEPEQRQTNEFDHLQMRTKLSVLDGLIMRFIKNPVFKATEVVNAEHSAKAGRDLQRIIEFSDIIRRSAVELKRK